VGLAGPTAAPPADHALAFKIEDFGDQCGLLERGSRGLISADDTEELSDLAFVGVEEPAVEWAAAVVVGDGDAFAEIEFDGGPLEVGEVSHAEAEGGMLPPAAGGGDQRAAFAADAVDGGELQGSAAGDDGVGASEAPIDEIGIVDVEIGDGTTGSGLIGEEFLVPLGEASEAFDAQRAKQAVTVVEDAISQAGPAGPEPHDHRRDAPSAGELGGLCKVTDSRGLKSHGFFDEHVPTARESLFGDRDVRIGGSTDAHGVEGGLGEELVGIAVDLDPAEINIRGREVS